MNQLAAIRKNDNTQKDRASHGSGCDSELLKLAEDVFAVDRQLDELVAEDQPKDLRFLALHKQWEQACSRVASLPASTNEGRRAKAKVLLATLDVIAPRTEERELHDELADSLARDELSLS